MQVPSTKFAQPESACAHHMHPDHLCCIALSERFGCNKNSTIHNQYVPPNTECRARVMCLQFLDLEEFTIDACFSAGKQIGNEQSKHTYTPIFAVALVPTSYGDSVPIWTMRGLHCEVAYHDAMMMS